MSAPTPHARGRWRLGALLRVSLSAVAVAGAAAALSSCAGCGSSRDGFDLPDASGAVKPDAGGALTEGGAKTACELAAARRSPLGCDYSVFAFPEATFFKLCTALIVSNPGTQPARLSIRYDGKALAIGPSARRITGTGRDPGWVPLDDDLLAPGGSAVINIVDGVRSWTGSGPCAFPALKDELAFVIDGTGSAFQLHADQPILATFRSGYGVAGGYGQGTASATLRAVPSWSAQYLDVGVYMPGRTTAQVWKEVPTGTFVVPDGAFAAFVAAEPTSVTVVTDAGSETYRLKTGEIYRLFRDDLHIGSIITADHPFGLFAGVPLAFIPYNVPWGNQILTQVAPTDSWASEYAAVGHPPRRTDRDDPSLFRIVAAKNGTAFVYDPSPPSGAPASLDAGGLAVFGSSTPFVVRSQDAEHPFYVSVSMTGSGPLCDIQRFNDQPWDGGSPGDIKTTNCPGGPSLIGIPRPLEYAQSFAFSTDYQFADTSLVLVRKKVGDRFADVRLDCAGTLSGWMPVGNGGVYETATIPLSRGNFAPQVYPGGSCQLGAHTMASDAPFTAFVWGGTHKGVDGTDPDTYAEPGMVSYGYALYGIEGPARPTR